MKNKTLRNILAVATVLAIVAGSIAVVSAGGISENGIMYSAVAIHDDPSSNHDIVNATLSEYTSAIYNRAYKENAVVKKSTPGQTVTTLSSSVTILDHAMCKAVDEDSNPIDRTSEFYTTDRYASLWYKLFVPKNLGYNGTVRWYDPDGNLEDEWTKENQARSHSYEERVLYNFFIAGNPPANKTGNWHVTFYLNGVKKFTEFFTISNLSTQTPSSPTIYVPDDYALIQDAVDAASPGDTIIVREGTYEENIEVYKSLTIRSENGPDSTIVLSESGDNVFFVTANYVNISGFTINGTYERTGIYLFFCRLLQYIKQQLLIQQLWCLPCEGN